jgi:CubicO group peptidase (beta-lactamase class C family)
MVATASDLARFASALLAGQLLRPETVTKAFTKQVTKTGRTVGYGLGWDVGERNGRREIWHTGARARVSNVLYLQPDERLVIAILTNLEGAGPRPLAQKIADLVRP